MESPWYHPLRMSRPASRRRFLGALAVASQLPGAAYVNPRKVLLWESTRKEFREALEGGALQAMIVPTGSTEQHNEHLAMINDTASVTLIAQQAALQLWPRVMVATPVPVGISPHWMDRKGTLTLKRETFLAVVYEICESLVQHGVKRILILNGHGGNVAPLRQSVAGFRDKLGIRIETNSYWDAYTPDTIKRYMESGRAPGHAGEFETSFALAAFPERIHWDGVNYERDKSKYGIKDPASAKQEEEFARDARLASAAKGEAMISIAADWVAGRLREML